MQNFNLIDSPWIPVRWRAAATGDTPAMVSLDDAFSRSAEIADLDCAPHERIALTRLLVCITHAALGAPEDADEWGDFGNNLAEAIPAYLKRDDIHPHFNLLGDGPRFLQEDVSSEKALVPMSKMIFNLATGNNPTLFDHSGGDAFRVVEQTYVPLALLTFQNFYPLFGTGYKGRGPCSDANAIHTILCGNTLKDTICLNLLDSETINSLSDDGMGIPIWECYDKNSLSASTKTFLGRLVPRHRSLKLRNNLDGFYHQNISLEYPKWEPYREASTTVILNRKEERKLLAAQLNKAVWRDLHALTVIKSENTVGAAPVLKSHLDQHSDGTARIWAGALITDLKAKILDTVESTFTVPKQLFCEAGQNIYAAGIEHAEAISKKLEFAVKIYWQEVTDPDPKKPAPAKGAALKQYWHSLGQQHRKLIQLAANPQDRIGKAAIGAEGANDVWTKVVCDAAIAAFDSVCPRSTPRQIQAYANGIKPLIWALFPESKKTKPISRTPAKSA